MNFVEGNLTIYKKHLQNLCILWSNTSTFRNLFKKKNLDEEEKFIRISISALLVVK